MYGDVITPNNLRRDVNPLMMTSVFISIHLLTGALLAGVGQVVVAGHVAPASVIVPHHHHTVFSGEKIAVRLPSVPVLIEL